MNYSSIPFRSEKVSIHIHDSLGYVIDPEKGKIRVLNEIGVEIWNTIDGSTSIKEILKKIGDIYEHKSHPFQKDVMNFLLQLKDRSLIYLKEE